MHVNLSRFTVFVAGLNGNHETFPGYVLAKHHIYGISETAVLYIIDWCICADYGHALGNKYWSLSQMMTCLVISQLL